ncbi:MAG TPA: DUF3164 family protein [Gammaproteobacteria bacterium]|nr:DUF3164 family protein [Gammaproteobacteria bacterium]
MNAPQPAIPDGYKLNGMGNLIAIENIKAIDLIRDEEVNKMVKEALLMKEQMIAFKLKITEMFENFVDLSFSEYGKKYGGKKGNISLTSFDNTMKVELSVSERISFNEQIQVAKELIEDYLLDKTKNVPAGIKTIALQAFKVDKNGQISTARVISISQYDIDDERWLKAMSAIKDSFVVSGTKNYMRFYIRDNGTAKWQAIPLDIAAL